MKIILIGNYLPDQQRSMIAFANLLFEEFSIRGLNVELLLPQPYFSILFGAKLPAFVKKWLAYVDKFILFPVKLVAKKFAERRSSVVFHIVDHSNAMYAQYLKGAAYVITCHDMLAVRGGLGDVEAFCPATRTGKILQKWILANLQASRYIACVSQATKRDFCALTKREGDLELHVIPNAVNAPFTPISAEELQKELPVSVRKFVFSYILMVGSSLPRKNRKTIIKALNSLAGRWDGVLVIAGQELSECENNLAEELKVKSKIIEVKNPTHSTLNALYGGAHALVFPSYAEGFGWPITEANACNCPVICSDRTSVPEVAGDSALVYDADDFNGFADGIVRLKEEKNLREKLISAGERNLDRFSLSKMIDSYMNLYNEALIKSQ